MFDKQQLKKYIEHVTEEIQEEIDVEVDRFKEKGELFKPREESLHLLFENRKHAMECLHELENEKKA